MLSNVIDIHMYKPVVGTQIGRIQECLHGNSLAKPRRRRGPNEQDEWFAPILHSNTFIARDFATGGTRLTIGERYEPHRKHKTQ